MRYFEDFNEGDVFELGSKTVTAEEIIEFGEEFDPAPFHLSEEGGRASMFGRLVASGWHSCAMAMRMICDAFWLECASQGSPGVEKCIWHAPVAPGDTLSGRAEVTASRPSASRPHIGFTTFRFSMFNQKDEPVLTMTNVSMLLRRHTAETAGGEAAAQ